MWILWSMWKCTRGKHCHQAQWVVYLQGCLYHMERSDTPLRSKPLTVGPGRDDAAIGVDCPPKLGARPQIVPAVGKERRKGHIESAEKVYQNGNFVGQVRRKEED
ncbi:hypothetical protein RRG08_039396 [Elysia crispata]|uniref:Uncharacterized protein n=1 Tax=Elysia crispata TaxID=231223 RepID=A0AAE0XV95_9GAST|nr:hypothetical protein RRG08_039396 [Elysia crispata]